MQQLVHQQPIGCINDLCMEKREIILKLRTADICRNCMQVLRNQLSDQYIRHARNIMESLRLKMLLSQNFLQDSAPSRMRIDRHKRIWLTDFGNYELGSILLKKPFIFFISNTRKVLLMGRCLSIKMSYLNSTVRFHLLVQGRLCSNESTIW